MRTSHGSVLVVGGGLIGCLSALRLRDAGLHVSVLERSVPGAEASSAAAGILAGQCESRAPGVLFDLAIESRERYAPLADELRDRVGADIGYRRCGTVDLAGDDVQLERLWEAFAWQRARGHRVETLDRAALDAREPSIAPWATGAVSFPDDAQVDPPRLVAAVAQAAERAGVQFRTGAVVRSVTVDHGRARGVETDDGVIEADHVVIAAGAWSSLIPGTTLPRDAVRPARGQIVELRVRTPPVRSVVYGRNGYVVPRADGRVICGSTLEFVGYRNEVTAGGVARILAMAIGVVPALEHAEMGRVWSNFRPYTQDHVALVGDAGGIASLTVATGHYRSGILMAPLTAELVCDRVMGRTPRAGIEVMSPSRSGLGTP